MVKKFKNRFLLVLVLIMAVTWVYQENGRPKQVAEHLITYITTRDYDLGPWISAFWTDQTSKNVSVSTSPFNLPCQFTDVVRHFGWYYNPQSGSQAFNPGVVVNIEPNTMIYPVLRGTVASLSQQENGFQMVVEHGDSIVSVIRGLHDVQVKEGDKVDEKTVLGKGSDLLYFEIRGKEGPINPEGLLNTNFST